MDNVINIGSVIFEAVTVAELKDHSRVYHSEDDSYIADVLTAARETVEKDLTLSIAGQAKRWYTEANIPSCLTLPVRPVQSVTSITYTDADGAVQTLDAEFYSLKAYRSDPQIEFTGELPTGTDVVVNFVAGYDGAPSLGINQVKIINGGSGYTDGTFTVTITGTPGTGTATLTVVAGVITTAVVLAAGTGFSSSSALYGSSINLTPLGAGTGAILFYTLKVVGSENSVPAMVKQAIKFLAADWFENREPVIVGTIAAALPLGYQRTLNLLRRVRFY